MQALKAKEQTEIAGEKEIVQVSAFEAQYNNKDMTLVEEEFQIAMDNNTSEGETEVEDVGEEFEVIFWEKNRYYIVDKDGQLLEGGEIIEDKNPGDITTGKDGEELDGSKEHPYEIWCIEDLIGWSQQYEKYRTSNVILCRNLNFKSPISYMNSESEQYGDINKDGKTDILMQEMNAGIGFTPIQYFAGVFDGKNYQIKNVYINSEDIVGGLFSHIGQPKQITIIKNITLTGNITGTKTVGGIIGTTDNLDNNGKIVIQKCVNKCTLNYNLNLTGVRIGGIGGILGENSLANTTNTVEILDCYNLGTINSISENVYSGTGGIIGCDYYCGLIVNRCYNLGTINGTEVNAGGIIGKGGNGIYNSYNIGSVKGSGISGRGTKKIYNCFNVGKVTFSGIMRGDYLQSVYINNVYTTSNIGNKPIVYTTIKDYQITNAFYSNKCEYSDNYGIEISEVNMQGEESNKESLVALLNDYVKKYNEENKNNEDFIELNFWEINENTKYPSLKY